MFGLGHHDAINERSGNQDLARMQRARSRDALHLHDDHAAGVLDGHGHRKVIKIECLPLGADVTVWIGCRAAQKRDLKRESPKEEPFLSIELDKLDDVLGGTGIDSAALNAGI